VSEVTHIFQSLDSGNLRDGGTAEELLPLVYEELRGLAAVKMAQQKPGQTLQATALVHEAFLRLAGEGGSSFQNQKHFFRSAAKAMQRILIEIARRKQTVRHGEQRNRVDLDAVEIPDVTPPDEFLRIQEALTRFENREPDKAEVVHLKYFIGLTHQEVAELLGLSLRTVERHWAYAKAWLARELEKDATNPET